MVDVHRSNPRAFEEMDVKLKQLDGYQGKVGYFDTAKYPDGTPVAYVAAIQELGHGPIPPRPTMRTAASKNREEWKKVAGIGAKKVMDGSFTGAQAMDLLATRAEGDVLQELTDITQPPLSPITLWARHYRKAGRRITGATIGEIAEGIDSGRLNPAGPGDVSTKPLNDTGYMIASLTHLTEKL